MPIDTHHARNCGRNELRTQARSEHDESRHASRHPLRQTSHGREPSTGSNATMAAMLALCLLTAPLADAATGRPGRHRLPTSRLPLPQRRAAAEPTTRASMRLQRVTAHRTKLAEIREQGEPAYVTLGAVEAGNKLVPSAQGATLALRHCAPNATWDVDGVVPGWQQGLTTALQAARATQRPIALVAHAQSRFLRDDLELRLGRTWVPSSALFGAVRQALGQEHPVTVQLVADHAAAAAASAAAHLPQGGRLVSISAANEQVIPETFKFTWDEVQASCHIPMSPSLLPADRLFLTYLLDKKLCVGEIVPNRVFITEAAGGTTDLDSLVYAQSGRWLSVDDIAQIMTKLHTLASEQDLEKYVDRLAQPARSVDADTLRRSGAVMYALTTQPATVPWTKITARGEERRLGLKPETFASEMGPFEAA